MKEFINSVFNALVSILSHPSEYTWLGWFVFITEWIIALTFIWIFVSLICYIIDSFFRPNALGEGTVVDKNYLPSHTRITMMNTGRSTVPMVIRHPERWSILISSQGKTDWFYLTQSLHDKIKIGQKISISYSIGRLFKGLYVRSVIIQNTNHNES